jgi:hypothetical protein
VTVTLTVILTVTLTVTLTVARGPDGAAIEHALQRSSGHVEELARAGGECGGEVLVGQTQVFEQILLQHHRHPVTATQQNKPSQVKSSQQ